MPGEKQSEFQLEQSDLEKFNLSVKSKSVDAYVTKYLQQYEDQGIDSKEKLYSGLLDVAISLKDESAIDLILQQSFHHEENILTFTNSNGRSLICNALYTDSPNIMEKIWEYITSHKKEFDKVDLDADSFELVQSVIFNADVQESPGSIIDHSFRPLYSEKSIKDLVSFIGQDTIDHYYT